ncbi:exodeoxyribonuclease VII small subunit [Arcanobacterium phocae]|uniref:exodeoxyribonuclease VII small subunit n=1 Tax=Arcanobacterium phocae TaxID=131112 RepID=UPI001C0F0BE8|nr:exodeoxyribonuclease VII small subunit [Arcanobacterium phocae]
MNPQTAEELDAAVAAYSYEEARSQLVDIVARLEQGNIPLEDALELWERGEALARRCETWLTTARERLAQAQQRTDDALATNQGEN